jgi:hypothetical protein
VTRATGANRLAVTSMLALAVLVGTGSKTGGAAFAVDQSAVMAPTAPPTLAYGPVNYGLEMAAWFDPRRAVAYCAIRNGNNLAVRYCDYLVGNFEFVELQARRAPADAWQRIARRRPIVGGYLSAGPRWHNIRWLRSGRIMPPGPYGDVRYSNPSRLKHTFEVSLKSFVFPVDWTGDMQIEIVQYMLNDVLGEESRGERRLQSMPLTITLPLSARSDP